ncbi:MAG: hypothetical protein V1681_03500 [Candidatus Neomarinimicrobiota bacterium]
MKKLGLGLLMIAFIILGIACEGDGLVTTGSKDVIVINHMTFAVTSTSFTSSKLTVLGTVTNGGTSTIYPDWYVEGDFYADSTFALKLGGDNYKMTFTLAPGESATWKLEFSSDLYLESDYPHFGIKNLRAFYYKED